MNSFKEGQVPVPMTLRSHLGNNMFPRWDYDVPSMGLFTEIVSLSGFWSLGCSRPINGDFSAISSMKFCLSAIYAKT